MWSWATFDNDQYRQPTLRSHVNVLFYPYGTVGGSLILRLNTIIMVGKNKHDSRCCKGKWIKVIWIGHLNPLLHAGKLFQQLRAYSNKTTNNVLTQHILSRRSTATCCSYTNSHRLAVEKKIQSYDIQLQNAVSDLKLYNKFIHKISIKFVI
jgi:hypothetical protein